MIEKCRICMLHSTINKCVNIAEKLNENSSILEAIVTISSVEVMEKDILPQVICKECYTNLVKCKDFRTQIICSDKVLKEELSNNLENHDSPTFIQPLDYSNETNFDANPLEDHEDVKSESSYTEHKENIEFLEISLKIKEETLTRSLAKKKTSVKPIRKHTCSECFKTFKNSSQLEDHNAYKHRERKYECEVCNKRFARKYDLAYHVRLHKGERPFTCEICGKSFSSSGYLQAHQKVHKGENPICSICKHKCTNSDQLQIHIRQKHTGERPYMCELCSHAFASNSSLCRHKKDVHNEKINCPICNKLYAKRVLKDHIKRHKNKEAGIKKYRCSECGKGFTSETCRKRHMVVHSGEKPYKCEICNKSFNQSSTLQTHKRIHSEIRPFGCDICSKSFKFKHHLKLHFEKYHKGEELVV